MSAKNEAKLMMFRGVESLLDTNSELISTVSALVTAVAAFKTVIAGILETMRDTDVDLAGIRVDKENSRQSLARMAADIAGFIRAFAAASGNHTLTSEVGYTFSDLMRVRSQQVVPRCRIIRDRGMENLDPLRNYGVTAPKLGAAAGNSEL